MTTATRATWLSALAVLLTSASLYRVYADLGWLTPVVGVVVAVALAGLLARRWRLPVLLQPVVGLVAAGLYAAVLYAQETFYAGLVPTAASIQVLGVRIGEGLVDVEELAPPVPATPGLVLLAVLGVGALAVVVDLVAVALRRPAVSGLPLLTLLVVPAATLDGGVGAVPFALGAAGWLALLMADSGERVGRWGTALRSGTPTARSDESSLGRVGRRIGVAALGTALVVPALLPGLESSLISGNGGSGLGGGSRSTTTYNPLTELAGQLRLPEPRNLLRYSTTDPRPDYLRLTTLDLFDDQTGWSSSALSADVRRDGVESGIPTPQGASSADVQPLTSLIEVQALDGPWLPIPPVPSEIEVDGPWLWDTDSQTVFSTRTELAELDDPYRVTAERVLPSPERLARGGAVPEQVAELALPPEVSPFVRTLTSQVVADAGAVTPYEQATALQAFFREGNGFQYSEDTSVPGIDAPNALEAFLRGKRGFCEQYASAMGAMARLLGLPARVAVGFTPGRQQADGTWQVTTSDAHAWPEVWFAGHGWVRFEPTPRGGEVITPGYSTAPTPDAAPDPAAPAAPVDPAAPVPGADGAPLGPDGRPVNDGAFDAVNGPADPAAGGRRWGLAGLGLLVVLAVPALLASVRRRRRWVSPSAHAAWAQVVEDAVDVGHRWRSADSPRAGAARLAAACRLDAAPASALHRVAAQVERARYARDTPDARDGAALQHDVAVVRLGLLAAASRRTRWTARLAPASTLMWMAHVSGARTADLLDRVDELLSAASGRVRRLLSRPTRSA